MCAPKGSHKAWFAIKLRDDDAPILESIRDRLGMGTVIRRTNGISKPQAIWVVQKKAECVALIEVFDTFPLRAKKARDFIIWKKAVLIWKDIRHMGCTSQTSGSFKDPNQSKLAILMRELREGRKYAQ